MPSPFARPNFGQQNDLSGRDPNRRWSWGACAMLLALLAVVAMLVGAIGVTVWLLLRTPVI